MANGGGIEPFGCHYLAKLVVVPIDQAIAAEGVLGVAPLDENGLIGATGERIPAEEVAQIRLVVAVFDVFPDDPLERSLTLRAADIPASPVHAVGFLHHIYAKPGTHADPIIGELNDNIDSSDPTRIVAIVDSGIVASQFLPDWLRGENVRFDDPEDIEELDNEVTESHGTFVAGLIRQISPTHTVSIAKAARLPVIDNNTFAREVPDHAAAPLPTTELDVLAAILRLINRHDGEAVEALNLSLGAYTCDPAGDEHLVAMAVGLLAWKAAHPESAIFAAGGNIPGSVPIWPAAYHFVRGVGAAGNGESSQMVWDPATEAVEQAAPRLWISDVAPGSKVVNLSGQGAGDLVVWSGSSFASPIAAASFVAGRTPIWFGTTFWWGSRPVEFSSVDGLFYEQGGNVLPPPPP